MLSQQASGGRIFVSFTKTYHHEPYDLISSTRPELSAAGKNVVITGGGTGIGKAIAISFAQAGAQSISILGRRLDRLENAAAEIRNSSGNTPLIIYKKTDLSVPKDVQGAFETIVQRSGKIDILVSNAGYFPKVSSVKDTDPEDYTQGFELNVLTALNVLKAFVPNAAFDAILLNISTSLAHANPMPGISGYSVTKAANLKMVDFFAVENPQIHVVNVQPGVVDTELVEKGTFQTTDSMALPGNFCVWLASSEAVFLKTKFVWANWDVQELMDRAEEIKSSRLLTWMIEGVDI
ncbi:short chain dehydrogenase reductase family protein [Colletotrichum incanum]|nr:short chain dehydrogenase reductase family protein [Colletotrichum incanum]